MFVLAGCGGGSHVVSTPSTRADGVVISGVLYRYASSVREVTGYGLEVDGEDYITPQAVASYPRSSKVVHGPSGLPIYIWTGQRLVALTPACVESPPPLGCG